jgi:hypothetical protein
MVVVLHIIKESAVDPKHAFLGSTKDIRSRTEYFLAKGIQVDEIVAVQRSDSYLLNLIKERDLSCYKAVLFEYPFYPHSIHYIKTNYPNIIILVRSHNAEFIHNLHKIQSRGIWTNFKSTIFLFRLAMLKLWREYKSAQYADYILSITTWEKDHYWRFLTNMKKVKVVPYYLAEKYMPSIPEKLPKNKQCVCLMSTDPNPFVEDAADNFIKMVDSLGDRRTDWQFYITGAAFAKKSTEKSRIFLTGMLNNPFEILLPSSAVALLSDYGYGFKTKLLDAVICRCHLIVTKGLYNRLPPEVQQYSHVVDLNSAVSFEDALVKSVELIKSEDVNMFFKHQAWAALDECLFFNQ